MRVRRDGPTVSALTVSALSEAYGGDLSAAARALGFASVKALLRDIKQYCST